MNKNIVERLQRDAGQLTISQLIQEREAAVAEINHLRSTIEKLRFGAEVKIHKRSTEIDNGVREQFRVGSLIRLKDVCELLSISRSTIYKRLSEDAFPQPVRLGPHTVRWRLEEIERWRDERALG